jgi:hypothetical protein
LLVDDVLVEMEVTEQIVEQVRHSFKDILEENLNNCTEDDVSLLNFLSLFFD